MPLPLDTPEGPDHRPLSVTRRGFGAIVGAAGFAAAVGPAAAQAIQTDEAGLITEAVRFPTAGFEMPSYLARPAAAGPHPVILVVHEIFGVHEYIRDVARRFAKRGYFAFVPDLYARAGDASVLDDFNEVGKIVRTATYDQVMVDLSNAVDWLDGARSDARVDRLGITGFCWGGAVVWMFTAHDPRVDAGVAWYGRLTDPGTGRFNGEADRPWPIDVADGLHGPVLGLYGGQDRGIPVSDVEKMQEALQGQPSKITLYPDAPHGFHADYRQSYRKEAATDAWDKALAWFDRHVTG